MANKKNKPNYSEYFLIDSRWRTSLAISSDDIQFDGEIICYDPDTLFGDEEWDAEPLSLIVKKNYKEILRCIWLGYIHFDIDCLNNLGLPPEKSSILRAANDAMLRFEVVTGISSKLVARPFPSAYQYETIDEIFKKDPKYLEVLFNVAITHTPLPIQEKLEEDKDQYPQCGTIFSTGLLFSPMGEISEEEGLETFERIISNLIPSNKQGRECLGKLSETLEEIRSEQEQLEEERFSRQQEYYDRMQIEESDRQFSDLMDDFDAWENID